MQNYFHQNSTVAHHPNKQAADSHGHYFRSVTLLALLNAATCHARRVCIHSDLAQTVIGGEGYNVILVARQW